MRLRRNQPPLTDEQRLEAEIDDLYKAEKRSRRVHIGFGIASIFLLGLLVASMFSFGGFAALTTAFWAVNLTLSISAIGCLLGAGISKIINRKNRAKIKLLKQAQISETHMKNNKALDNKAIQKNKLRFAKTYQKGQKHLTEAQKQFLLHKANFGVDRATERPAEEETDWRRKESLSSLEAVNVLSEYKPLSNEKIKEEFETTAQDAKIEHLVLYPTGGRPIDISNFIEADNDVSYNMAKYDMMNIINKTKGLAGVKMIETIDGETNRISKPYVEGKPIFDNDEVKAVKEKIESKRSHTL